MARRKIGETRYQEVKNVYIKLDFYPNDVTMSLKHKQAGGIVYIDTSNLTECDSKDTSIWIPKCTKKLANKIASNNYRDAALDCVHLQIIEEIIKDKYKIYIDCVCRHDTIEYKDYRKNRDLLNKNEQTRYIYNMKFIGFTGNTPRLKYKIIDNNICLQTEYKGLIKTDLKQYYPTKCTYKIGQTTLQWVQNGARLLAKYECISIADTETGKFINANEEENNNGSYNSSITECA